MTISTEEAVEDDSRSQPVRTSAVDRPKPVVIRLERLSKEYVEAGQRHLVLDHLDRRVLRRRICLSPGQVGKWQEHAAKSHLRNRPPIERACYHTQRLRNNVTITALKEHQRTMFRREHIGIVFQFFNLIPTLTVLENVTLPLELAGKTDDVVLKGRWTVGASGPGKSP